MARQDRAQFRKFAASLGFVVFLALLLQSHFWIPAFATSTYYVDYANGCDTNDGLHETQVSGSCPTGGSGPFKHAPGMEGLTPANVSTSDGCVSNCAAVTVGAGTVIVLKGGVVWPNTVFPWTISTGGTSSTQTYGCAGAGCAYVGNAIGAGLSAWNAGVVNSVTLTRDLCGWSSSSPPAVGFIGGGGTGAAATAEVVPPYSATVPPPAGFQNDPNVAGCIYHINVTNQGSGYTSAPMVTISGTNSNGAGVWAKAVADIDRPVMDLGATQGSPIDWNPQNGSPRIVPFCPQAGAYTIVYGIECRNVMVQNTTSSIFVYGYIGTGAHGTMSHNYFHGLFVDCAYPVGSPTVSGGCFSNSTNDTSNAISVSYPYDQAIYNVIENGDSFFVQTAAQKALNIGPSTGPGGAVEFSEMGFGEYSGYGGPVDVEYNIVYGGAWQVAFQRNNVAGDETTPFIDANNETWLSMYAVNPGAHINRHYSRLTCKDCSGGGGAILVSYNNIDHNHVRGSGNQQQCNVGQVFYFFNWVAWAWGTSTPGFGINTVSPGTGGCSVYLVNSTLIDTFNDTSGLCINSNGSATDATPIVVQNLQCLSATSISQFWSGGTNINFQNYAGSTVTANVQAASVADTIANALTQGYGLGTLFSAPGETLTFASSSGSANLTSLCNSQTYLAPLCSDINGVPRPATGGWQAGAHQQGGVVLPPLNLSLSAH